MITPQQLVDIVTASKSVRFFSNWSPIASISWPVEFWAPAGVMVDLSASRGRPSARHRKLSFVRWGDIQGFTGGDLTTEDQLVKLGA